MPGNDFIRQLSERAAALFPAADSARRDLEKRLYDLLQSSFERLNLVTREEFDAQRAVLERARITVAELERKVAELEARLGEEPAAGKGDSPDT